MITIAFWNVHKASGANLVPAIAALADSLAANQNFSGANGELILCLGEPGALTVDALLGALNAQALTRPWWCQRSLAGRFICLGTTDRARVNLDFEVKGCLPATLNRGGNGQPSSYEIWFVHLEAPMQSDNPQTHQSAVARELRQAIEAREQTQANNASIAIGDFNMQPFSAAMTAPDGLNAAACATVAGQNNRIVRGTPYSYFYNPMWERLGSISQANQPGSFYKRYNTNSVYWHLYDQVIVRPKLSSLIVANSARILTRAGNIPLITTRGVIEKDISDHLPVAIALNI